MPFVAAVVSGLRLLRQELKPEGIEVVPEFDLEKYYGRWYEIARLPHWFEKGLDNSQTFYRPGEDGRMEIFNMGQDLKNGAWQVVPLFGKKVWPDSEIGQLKVALYPPLWGGYNILALDTEGYRWAMVAGSDKNYLWILSRKKTLDEGIKNHLVAKAASMGYDTSQLYYPKQGPSTPPAIPPPRHRQWWCL